MKYTIRQKHSISKFILSIFLPILIITGCGKAPPDPTAGNTAFFVGKYDQALVEYQKAFGSLPDDETMAIRMAICQFAVGNYMPFMEVYNHYLKLSNAFQKFKPHRAAVQILRSNDYGGLKSEEITRPSLMLGDFPHLLKSRLFHRIALKVTINHETDEQKAMALLDWFIRNVRPNKKDSKEDHWSVLMKGFGFKDACAWSFVSLARQLGLDGHVVHLRESDGKTSSIKHTLSTIRINNKWCFFDVSGGISLRDPSTNKLVTIKEIIHNPKIVNSITKIMSQYPVSTNYFKNAIYNLTFAPAYILPRMNVLQQIFQQEAPNPIEFPTFHNNLGAAFHQLTESKSVNGYALPYTFPGQKYQVDIWKFPFEIARASSQDWQYYSDLPKAQAENRVFREARLHHLLGDDEQAISEFEKIANGKNPLASESLYFASLCHYEIGNFEKAIKGFNQYLNKNSNGAWSNQANLNLGYAYQIVEKGEEAKKHLKQVKGPRKLAAMLALNNPKESHLKEKAATMMPPASSKATNSPTP